MAGSVRYIQSCCNDPAPDDWPRVKDLFERARAQAPERRAQFLADTCAGNAAVRREVESLLASFDEAESFLETPAAQVVERAGSAGRRHINKAMRFVRITVSTSCYDSGWLRENLDRRNHECT